MRQSILPVTLLALLAVASCHNPPKEPPTAPPPAAPAVPPPAPAPEKNEPAPAVDDYHRVCSMAADEIDRLGLLAEAHFDYDKADLREADRTILAKNAEVLKKYDCIKVSVEGHCDERGSVEYNLALGEKRARASYDYLVSLGIPVERVKTVSFGKEFPVCQQSNEECWGRNRRDHFTVSGKAQSAH